MSDVVKRPSVAAIATALEQRAPAPLLTAIAARCAALHPSQSLASIANAQSHPTTSVSSISQSLKHDVQPSVSAIVKHDVQPSVSAIARTALNHHDQQPSVSAIVRTMREGVCRAEGFIHGVQVGSAASNGSEANELATAVTSINALSDARHKAQEISAWAAHCAEQASRLEQALSAREKLPSFLKGLASADKMGALKDTSIKAAILEGMGRTLLRGGSCGRPFSPGEKSFYGLMLTYGGVGALHVVSNNAWRACRWDSPRVASEVAPAQIWDFCHRNRP